MKTRRLIAFAALLAVFLSGLGWLILRLPDPLFHGKPESVWIASIEYDWSDEQNKRWREWGPEGIRVLIRGLERANRPWEQAYRKMHWKLWSIFPKKLFRLLPAPKMDSSRATRMCIVSLLGSLRNDVAMPAMVRALKDEDRSVRQLAIGFFTQGEDENVPLNRMDVKTKRKLLPEFIRAMQDTEPGIRNNAAIALRYYPEAAGIVVPVLVKALQDHQDPLHPIPEWISESLHQLAKAGAVPALIGVLKNPDSQIAYRAAELLGKMRREPALTVPALIESARGTNAIVARASMEALGNFPDQAEAIVPVFLKALDGPEGLVRWSAAAALKKIDPAAAAKAGLK